MADKLRGKRSWYEDYLLIIIGTCLMALAISSVFDPAGMITGGFSGVAIIVKHITEPWIDGGLPLWLTNILLNVPLFFLGIRIRGFQFVKKALLGEFALSFWLFILPVFPIAGEDLFLTSIYGGVLLGAGLGLVFLGRGTTGGTDMLAAIIWPFLSHYSVAQIMQVIDAAIVIVGLYFFGIQKVMYAIISIFLVTKVTDGMIEGLKFAKGAYIITENYKEVSRALLDDLDRGVTGIHVKGMYSNEEKMMLFCVVGQTQIVALKELVYAMDPNAFIIVSDVREVLGEGFIESYGESM